MSYKEAKAKYAKIGIDTEAAIKALGKVAISINTWQIDDIKTQGMSTDELLKKFGVALDLIPGKHRINVHSLYAEDAKGNFVDRDKITKESFRKFVDFAKKRKIGFDFNPSCFMHPKAANGALADPDPKIRAFWVKHAIASLKTAEAIAKELKSPVSWTLWSDAGKADEPSDRMGPRRRLKESLDKIFKTKYNKKLVKACLECQLWCPAKEAYSAGSNEFMTNYAAKHDLLCLWDMAHFHPTESVADKISAMLLFSGTVAFHIGRPVRWAYPHVSRYDDQLRDVAREIVANDPKNFILALDFCDSTMNRVASLVIGTRNVQRALLEAMLLPRKELTKMQDECDTTGEFVLQEDMKMYPLGEVWDEFCRRQKCPLDGTWLGKALKA